MNRGTLLEKGFCCGHKGIQGFTLSEKKENLTPGPLKVPACGREMVIKVEIWTLKPNHPGLRASSTTHSRAVPLGIRPTVSLGVLICKLQRTGVWWVYYESRALVWQICYMDELTLIIIN